ncbi:MAG: hypothetical protein H6714_06280 [Myxococcales bacterium]|nr:hypothetical protein [Myxococcales bacterium]
MLRSQPPPIAAAIAAGGVKYPRLGGHHYTLARPDAHSQVPHVKHHGGEPAKHPGQTSESAGQGNRVGNGFELQSATADECASANLTHGQ